MRRNGQYQPSKDEKKKPGEADILTSSGRLGLCDRKGVLTRNRTR
ncbi:hypothetical protein [uncultured Prevotella sp.]|nr:hypothetical protein [uncultured Prevotella sp.]